VNGNGVAAGNNAVVAPGPVGGGGGGGGAGGAAGGAVALYAVGHGNGPAPQLQPTNAATTGAHVPDVAPAHFESPHKRHNRCCF
jgi:hypothetical protein